MIVLTMKQHEEKLNKKHSADHKKTGYQGKDSREGRLHTTKTDRGDFRFKSNKKDE